MPVKNTSYRVGVVFHFKRSRQVWSGPMVLLEINVEVKLTRYLKESCKELPPDQCASLKCLS